MDKKETERKRILLVDDERAVRAATKMLLEVDDYEVAEAENGAAALALFDKQKFNLVITDFRMEKMNGGELAVRIRKNHPGVPIILITGFHDEVPPGAFDQILYKPFSWDELRRAISSKI